MDLTSLARVKRLIKTDSGQNDALLRQLITSVSATIGLYLGRHLQRLARVEQYKVQPGSQMVWLRGYPIKATPVAEYRNSLTRDFATAVLIDPSAYWQDSSIGRVAFDQVALIYGEGVMQATYTGGMADTGARLVAASSALSPANTIAAGNLVIGRTSGALGTLATVPGDPGSVSLDVDAGAFVATEILDCYPGTLQTPGVTVGYFTLGAFTAEPMAQLFPEVTAAAETQVVFEFFRKDQLGVASISAEGGSVSLDPAKRLLPGVKDDLRNRKSRVYRG